jgi:DNA-binding winged helix-turn-helix (wHTH) protein/tetratricopeptide (TPR) repeat protein
MATSVSSNAVVRFGVFEADLRSGELRKGGVKVKIQELPFQALKLLVSRPNEVLSREDMRQALWPEGVYVDFDRGVISAINRLRDALGDSAENPVFIETVGRRGYRWIASTHSSDLPAEVGGEATDIGETKVVAAAAISSHRDWKLVFVLSVLVLLFSVWFFRTRRPFSISALSGRSSMAKAVARANVSPSAASEPDHHAAKSVTNPEAEEFYLKGRYYWNKRTPESLNKAVDSFTQAIVHDPNYSQAYVGLADSYNLLREYTVMPSSEAYPRALSAAKKAVELDDQSSGAHASLAFVSFFGMWDAATADREFKQAIVLNPNNALAHHWYASYLSCLRRDSDSLAEIERARAIDPASKSILADKGSILFNADRQPEATALLKQMEENEPDFISPHRYLKLIYLQTGDYPRYLIEARKEAVLMHDSSALAIADATEKGFAGGGGQSLLEALLLQEKKLYDRGLFSPFDLAQTCALMGKKREALQYLKIAYDQHADGVSQMEAGHGFDKLHDEPAFRRMLADVGLPPLN